MCPCGSNSVPNPGPRTTKTKNPLLFAICVVWLIASIAIAIHFHGRHHSGWRILVPLVASIALSWSVFDTKTFFGKIEHVEIHSPHLIDKIRRHYISESDQLAVLGFDPLFYFGEAISIFRLFLIFPAVVLFQMWMKKVPMALHKGTKIVSGNPVFGARDKMAYAHPNMFGITFHTAFRDGSLLLTKNYTSGLKYPPEIRVQEQVGNLTAIWEMHKQSVQQIATGLNPADRQSSFPFYSQIVSKEVPVE